MGVVAQTTPRLYILNHNTSNQDLQNYYRILLLQYISEMNSFTLSKQKILSTDLV